MSIDKTELIQSSSTKVNPVSLVSLSDMIRSLKSLPPFNQIEIYHFSVMIAYATNSSNHCQRHSIT